LSDASQTTVLLCATTWWPLSARLAIAFLGHGSIVSGVCPPGHPLRFVSGVKHLFPYRRLDSSRSLKAAIVASQPALIVPCDDGVVWQLHELHATCPELRALIERSLGSADAYPTLRSRGNFLQTAAALGIRVPSTKVVESEDSLKGWGVDTAGVLKLDGTWGGSGVIVIRSETEAIAAYRKLSAPVRTSVAWKRWLINHDPLALWSWRRDTALSVTIQQFIPGRPANTMFVCWQGEIQAMVTVEVLTAQGMTGAATVVRLVRNPEIEQVARLLAQKFKLSGFHGLDFILEQDTHAAYLIEHNPRCTQLGHLRLSSQGDLAEAICAKLREDQKPSAGTSDGIAGDTIAFFPQAFRWNPKSEYLRHGYHDVPWEEPMLVRELMREPWPERQFLNRLYHWFRPMKLQKEMKFQG
jgi:ATP-grasp domain-containing protein